MDSSDCHPLTQSPKHLQHVLEWWAKDAANRLLCLTTHISYAFQPVNPGRNTSLGIDKLLLNVGSLVEYLASQ